MPVGPSNEPNNTFNIEFKQNDELLLEDNKEVKLIDGTCEREKSQVSTVDNKSKLQLPLSSQLVNNDGSNFISSARSANKRSKRSSKKAEKGSESSKKSSLIPNSSTAVSECEISNQNDYVKELLRNKVIYNNRIDAEFVDLKNPQDCELAIHILSKENKTKKEKEFLQKSIKGLNFFKKNSEQIFRANSSSSLFDSLEVKFFPANTEIFNFGEFGFHFYIMLKGQVQLLIPNPDIAKEIERKRDEQQIQLNSQNKGNTLPATSNQSAQLKQDQNSDSSMNRPDLAATFESILEKTYKGWNQIKLFGPGDSFGEIALITKQRRTGTMLCKSDTHVMSLSKQAFDSILGNYHQRIKQERIGFLRRFQIFDGIPDSKLMSVRKIFERLYDSLLLDMKIIIYSMNSVVYAEGDQVEDVYFIKGGEVELSFLRTTVDSPSNKSSQSEDVGGNNFNMKCSMFNLKKARDFSRETTQRMKICLLENGQCFGDRDIKDERRLRTEKAVVTLEGTEIYSLRKSLLLDMLKTHKTTDNLQRNNMKNEEFHKKRELDILDQSIKTQDVLKSIFTKQVSRRTKKMIKLPDLSDLSEEERRMLYVQFPFMKVERERQEKKSLNYFENVRGVGHGVIEAIEEGSRNDDSVRSIDEQTQDNLLNELDESTYQQFTSKFFTKPIRLKLSKDMKEKLDVSKILKSKRTYIDSSFDTNPIVSKSRMESSSIQTQQTQELSRSIQIEDPPQQSEQFSLQSKFEKQEHQQQQQKETSVAQDNNLILRKRKSNNNFNELEGFLPMIQSKTDASQVMSPINSIATPKQFVGRFDFSSSNSMNSLMKGSPKVQSSTRLFGGSTFSMQAMNLSEKPFGNIVKSQVIFANVQASPKSGSIPFHLDNIKGDENDETQRSKRFNGLNQLISGIFKEKSSLNKILDSPSNQSSVFFSREMRKKEFAGQADEDTFLNHYESGIYDQKGEKDSITLESRFNVDNRKDNPSNQLSNNLPALNDSQFLRNKLATKKNLIVSDFVLQSDSRFERIIKKRNLARGVQLLEQSSQMNIENKIKENINCPNLQILSLNQKSGRVGIEMGLGIGGHDRPFKQELEQRQRLDQDRIERTNSINQILSNLQKATSIKPSQSKASSDITNTTDLKGSPKALDRYSSFGAVANAVIAANSGSVNSCKQQVEFGENSNRFHQSNSKMFPSLNQSLSIRASNFQLNGDAQKSQVTSIMQDDRRKSIENVSNKQSNPRMESGAERRIVLITKQSDHSSPQISSLQKNYSLGDLTRSSFLNNPFPKLNKNGQSPSITRGYSNEKKG